MEDADLEMLQSSSTSNKMEDRQEYLTNLNASEANQSEAAEESPDPNAVQTAEEESHAYFPRNTNNTLTAIHPTSVAVNVNEHDNNTCISDITDHHELFQRASFYPSPASMLANFPEEDDIGFDNIIMQDSNHNLNADSIDNLEAPLHVQAEHTPNVDVPEDTCLATRTNNNNNGLGAKNAMEDPESLPLDQSTSSRAKDQAAKVDLDGVVSLEAPLLAKGQIAVVSTIGNTSMTTTTTGRGLRKNFINQQLENLEAAASAKEANEEVIGSDDAAAGAGGSWTIENTQNLPGAYPVRSTMDHPPSRPPPPTRQEQPETAPAPMVSLSATLSPASREEEERRPIPKPHPLPAVIVEGTTVREKNSPSIFYGFFFLAAFFVIVGLAIGLATHNPTPTSTSPLGSNSSNNNNTPTATSPTPASLSRLAQIKERGVLRCGYIQFLLMLDPETGIVDGFSSNWCTAVAAAIWGAQGATKRVEYIFDSPFRIENGTHFDMGPVAHGGSLEYNSYFTRPTFYAARRIGGERFFVEHCVEQNDFKHIDECQDLQLCVFQGNLEHGHLLKDIPPRKMTMYEDPVDLVGGFLQGKCNLFFTSRAGLPGAAMKDFFQYQGDYTSSDTVYGTSRFSVVTTATEDEAADAHWTDFVNTVIQSLMVAEQENITQSTWYQFPETQVFGAEYKDMFRNAIQAVGNYGEIYSRYLPVEDRLMNHLNNGTTGLIQSLDIQALSMAILDGQHDNKLGKNLQKILDRGHLLCGVQWGGTGSATKNTSGMDVDFCRTVAASLFSGNGQAVELVDASEDGFIKMASGEIDVLAGATWSLENDAREPTTGLGFAFSQPYLYGPDEPENLCLATLQDDKDWASFVYFVVAATVYAEQQNLTSTDSNKMPFVDNFGPDLRRMFRDAIFQSGHYGEIYSRNLDIPRTGRNLLESSDGLGPKLYPMPGFM